MRLAAFALAGSALFLFAASAIEAQQSHPVNPSGFGSVLYPGTGVPPPSAHGGFGSVLNPGTGVPPGVKAPGRPNGTPGNKPVPPPAAHPQHSRTVVVPVPVYYGGSFFSDSGNGYAQQPAPSYDYGLADAAPGQSPVVIINQGYRPDYVNPSVRDYSNVPLPEPGPDYRASDQPTIYLVALSDHTIIPTIAYWVDGDTLNYITTEGSQNRISLSLVDREFSQSLNDTRNVEFKLPPVK
jgi:hypothetical protein